MCNFRSVRYYRPNHIDDKDMDAMPRVLAKIMLIVVGMSAGCVNLEAAPLLPTATLPPAVSPPTATATFLAPPTVTSLPTATPRLGGVSVVVSSESVSLSPDAQASSPTGPTSVPAAALTATPSLTPTELIAELPEGFSLGSRIYYSDFSSPGWLTINDPTAKVSAQNSSYVFEIGPFDARFVTTASINGDDLYSQVEVTPSQCEGKEGYGLIFRYKDSANYYLFTIYCDGTYSAIAKSSGAILGMATGNLPADYEPGSATVKRIGVLAYQSSYILFLNGKPLNSFADAGLLSGDVGLYATSQIQGVLKVSFDNLSVWTVNK